MSDPAQQFARTGEPVRHSFLQKPLAVGHTYPVAALCHIPMDASFLRDPKNGSGFRFRFNTTRKVPLHKMTLPYSEDSGLRISTFHHASPAETAPREPGSYPQVNETDVLSCLSGVFLPGFEGIGCLTWHRIDHTGCALQLQKAPNSIRAGAPGDELPARTGAALALLRGAPRTRTTRRAESTRQTENSKTPKSGVV